MARHTTCPSSKRLASSLLLVGILSGCASQQTFRVVDAKSGELLGDVQVERLEGGYRPSAMPFVVLNELSPVEKQTTNQSGSVTFQKSGSKFIVNPSGDNPAYNDAYVKVNLVGSQSLLSRRVPRGLGQRGRMESSRSPCNVAGSPEEPSPAKP